MATHNNVIYVHFKVVKPQRDYFFGSVAAIYSQFTYREMGGIRQYALCDVLRDVGKYENDLVIVIKGRIIRSRQKAEKKNKGEGKLRQTT
ncbi:MAG: hypothetical protein LUI09_04560 [Prevotellaceae bacterium]|nr:hypothetical protein [Prevotellaceae bacterium]